MRKDVALFRSARGADSPGRPDTVVAEPLRPPRTAAAHAHRRRHAALRQTAAAGRGRFHLRPALCAALAVALAVPVTAWGQEPSPRQDRIVARVNGRPVRRAEVRLLARLQGIDEDRLAGNPQTRQRLIDQAIDRELLRQYLDERSVPVPRRETELLIKTIEQRLARDGKSLDRIIAALGLTREDVRQIVGLQLRWSIAARRMISEREIRAYWSAHRAELDGTQVRIRHIVRRIDGNDAGAQQLREQALREFGRLRERIRAGELTFEQAAPSVSDAPSKDNGGDLGFIPFRGAVLPEVARVAFRTPVGEISEPFESPVGVHMVQVVARREGTLSLEDARAEIFRRLAANRQAELLERLRRDARIEQLD